MRTPLTMGVNIFSAAANAIGSFADGGSGGEHQPAIYERHVWTDDCGKCHSEIVTSFAPRAGA